MELVISQFSESIRAAIVLAANRERLLKIWPTFDYLQQTNGTFKRGWELLQFYIPKTSHLVQKFSDSGFKKILGGII